jgi:hypothetical protein
VPYQVGGPLEVVLYPGGDIVEDQLLGGTSAQQHIQAIEQLGTCHQIPIFHRLLLGIPQRRDATRDDGDLRHAVGMWACFGHQGMAGFVIRDDFLFFRVDDA